MTTHRLSKPPHRWHSHRKDGHGKPRFLDELIRTNPPAFSAFYLEEPKLVFGEGLLSVDPKAGLESHGPFGWQSATIKTIRFGVIGTGDGIQTFLNFLQKCQSRISAGFNTRGKPLDPHCFPDFPGCSPDHTFRASFVADNPSHLKVIHKELFARAAAEHKEQSRIEAVVKLVVDQLSALQDLSPTPDVVVLVMPPSVEAACAGIGDVFARQKVKLSPQQRFQRSLQREAAATGQTVLGLDFDTTDQTDSSSHIGFFNIHHALKAHAMRTGFTTQVVWESTLKDSNSASVAWNLFTALYYKAGNNPWRLQSLPDNTCYVGVSFFKESPRIGADMQTSLAQVFGAGEGIVLKGEKAVFNKERDRKPHLSEDGAEKLLTRAIQSYTLQHNAPPKRVVVHKTSPLLAGGIARDAKGARWNLLLRLSGAGIARDSLHAGRQKTAVTRNSDSTRSPELSHLLQWLRSLPEKLSGEAHSSSLGSHRTSRRFSGCDGLPGNSRLDQTQLE